MRVKSIHVMDNKAILSKDSLREFVHHHAKKKGITFRKIGEALGMKPAYFSDLMSGRKRRSVEFLNALAEYLKVQRVDVYQAAGLLQISEYETLRTKLDDLLMNEPTIRQALDMLVGLEREDMLKLASWMILNSVGLIQIRTGAKFVGGGEEALLAFPENSTIAPPAFMNMLYQIVSEYFRLDSKGKLVANPKSDPQRDHAEKDGAEIDLE